VISLNRGDASPARSLGRQVPPVARPRAVNPLFVRTCCGGAPGPRSVEVRLWCVAPPLSPPGADGAARGAAVPGAARPPVRHDLRHQGGGRLHRPRRPLPDGRAKGGAVRASTTGGPGRPFKGQVCRILRRPPLPGQLFSKGSSSGILFFYASMLSGKYFKLYFSGGTSWCVKKPTTNPWGIPPPVPLSPSCVLVNLSRDDVP